jgi:predicted chitinase
MKALRQNLTRAPTPAITRPRHLVLQRAMNDARSLEKREAFATARVDKALDSPGLPLDTATRGEMESRFGHDFANVRVHADATAADAARAVNATAYTLGKDIVFRAGAYEPQTQAGKRLLAHELTHVVQQGDGEGMTTSRFANAAVTLSQPSDRAEQEASRGAEAIMHGMSFAPMATMAPGTGAIIQRADDEWNKAYGERKSKSGKSFEDYKKDLGQLRATTAGGIHAVPGGGGTPAAPEIEFKVLMEIYPGMARDVKNDNKLPEEKRKGREKQAREYLDSLNQAFHAMKIDTVEAQANYLAHAYVESDQFRQFTETAGVVRRGAQKWQKDPTTLALDQIYLAETYNKEDTPEAKSRKKTVNPGGKFEFIGRGPVQVTHNWGYTEVIAMLEKAAEDYKAEAALSSSPEAKTEAEKYATLAQRAADAVKANPQRAADPEFTFLFSAAHMKRTGADVGVASAKVGATWTGADPGSSWVAGGKQKPGSPQAEALESKSNAYARIYPVLLREAKKPATQVKTP